MEFGVSACNPSLQLLIFVLIAWIIIAIPDCSTWRDAGMCSIGLVCYCSSVSRVRGRFVDGA